MDLGINLSPATYYSSQFPWTNFACQLEEWRTQNAQWIHNGLNSWNTNFINAIPKDKNGYPLEIPFNVNGAETQQIVSALMCRGINGNYPAGIYRCTFDGDGDINFSFDATVISREPGLVVFQVNPTNNGVKVDIVRSTANNHVRNIKILPPDIVGGELMPNFKQFCDPFNSLRFMDLQRINGLTDLEGSIVANATDYYGPDHYTQTGPFGVSPFKIVEICNILNKDAWVCIPHLASNDYVLELAKFLKNNLKSHLKIRFELSNEVWNSQFKQARDAALYGKILSLAPDTFTAQMRMYAWRAKQVFSLIHVVFADQPTRFKCVLCGQAANTYALETALSFQDVHQLVHEIGIAPYFGGHLGDPQSLQTTLQMSVEQILEACYVDIFSTVKTRIEQHMALAGQYGKSLVAYEGGQHLSGYQGTENVQALTDLFIAANNSPAMGELYKDYLSLWDVMVGGHMCLFRSMDIPSKWGSWGLIKHQEGDWSTDYKYKAITTS